MQESPSLEMFDVPPKPFDGERQNHDMEWQYFRNAAAVLPEMIFTDTDLLGVQSIVAMASVISSEPHTLC